MAISGLISMSPLAMQEATAATRVRCVTAAELQAGILESESAADVAVLSAARLAPATNHNGVHHELRQRA